MPRYSVELTATVFVTVEVEADNEAQATEFAYDEADEELRWESVDWDVDYIEEIED